MAAKLALALVVLAIVVVAVVVATYRYLDNAADRDHEKEMARMEQTDRMVEIADTESGLDGQLARDDERG